MRDSRKLARDTLERVAANPTARKVVETPRVSREVVRRYVAGESQEALLDTCAALQYTGRLVAVTRLDRRPTTVDTARERGAAYREVISALDAAGLTKGGAAELSVSLAEFGRYDVDAAVALEELRSTAASAAAAGMRLAVEAPREQDTDDLLQVAADLRGEHPDLVVALFAANRRTESDCRDLAGTAVRLMSGPADPDLPSAFDHRVGVDRAFARCTKILIEGSGTPTISTSDLRLLRITETLARRAGRAPGSYEYMLRHGVRPTTQTVIADRGDRLRVYVPYGTDWYPYLVHRIAEQPSNLAAMVRAAVGR